MKMTQDQVQSLLHMLSLTRDEETTCGDCLQHMAEFVETTLAGKTVREGLKSLEKHLEFCGECHDEFDALRDALRGESGTN